MDFVLETIRLQLRPCRTTDLAVIHAFWTNDRVRYFLFDDRTISADEARSFVEESRANFARYGYGLWLIFVRDGDHFNAIGFAGLLHSKEDAPNLIYGVHPRYWGRGYATEAAGAVLRHAFAQLALSLVKADVDEPNLASVRVLEKLGMKLTESAAIKGRPVLYFERPRSVDYEYS